MNIPLRVNKSFGKEVVGMDRQEFDELFSSLTPEQQEALIIQYEELLNAHNPQKSRLALSA